MIALFYKRSLSERCSILGFSHFFAWQLIPLSVPKDFQIVFWKHTLYWKIIFQKGLWLDDSEPCGFGSPHYMVLGRNLKFFHSH